MDIDKLRIEMAKFLDEDDNIDFIVGKDTDMLMAKAALNVLDAVREVQEYGKTEGYFTDK